MEIEGEKSRGFVKLPFENERRAQIAYQVLSVDKEPKRNFVEKIFSLEGDVLAVEFKAANAKSLRNSINSFFEHFLLCQETIKRFDVKSKQ